MCGAIYKRWSNKSTFHKYITEVAKNIRTLCKVNDWQTANEKQLKVRDDLHREIALLCDVLKDPKLAVQIAFARVMKVEHVIPQISVERD
ncbi:KilA-N domain-containing protein [Vibrio phage vB_VpP_1]|nr:KilA-N domain-containing protein [Vibrio phage vB_VpP_1]